MADFNIKRGDLLPRLKATLKYPTKVAINLTGATVQFRMRKQTLAGQSPAALKVNAAATVVSAAEGIVEYAWQGSDTDTTGTYEAEWVISFAGTKLTVPNDRCFTVDVVAGLG